MRWRSCASPQNPRDRIAGFRVAQLLPGVGPATAARIVEAAGADDGFAALGAFAAPAKAREDFAPFAALMRALAAPGAPWPADLAQAIAWLRPHARTAP